MFTRTLLVGSLLSILVAVPEAGATPLWIIHTNDLHSHLENAGTPGKGGYARVKTVINRLKAEATAQGVGTLVLDGGDFTEGSQFYFAERGHHAWQVMNAMGYDAVVVGNHDWLAQPGPIHDLTFALLGANFKPSENIPFLRRFLRPSAIFERDGSRIGVVGLTSPELMYNWVTSGSLIGSHVAEGLKAVNALREKEGADFVIALNHLGLEMDKETAKAGEIQMYSVLEKSLYTLTPIKAEIRLPKINFLGWAAGLLVMPNSRTELAPKAPIKNKASIFPTV